MHNTFLTTLSTTGVVEVVHQIPTDGNTLLDIGKIIIQVIVGITGLIKLLKERKNVKKLEQQQKQQLQ